MEILLAILGAGSGGGFLAVGSAANARLKAVFHSPIAAAAVNFGVGFGLLTLLIALGLFPPPAWANLAVTPWWAFVGGLLGAIFVSLNTLIIPKLGLTTTTLTVVCSQMTMSLVVDQFGWFGVPTHALNPARVVAIGLLLVAIALTQLDRRAAPEG
ncbi:MAG TPA: DMT family transporter [Candidatus Obscuribacterales bacterium]